MSDVLSEPFVNLDEYGFADENVRHAMKIFIDGRIKLPVENRQLTINCVPLITTNPVKKARWFSLEYMLDIKEPQVRRSIILFTDTVGLTREWLVKYGEDIVNYASSSKPIPIGSFKPPRRKVFSRDDKYEVYELVSKYVNQSIFDNGYIDIDMLMQLAVGALAYIPVPEKALRRVIQNYLRIVATLGWVRTGKLNNLFNKEDATKLKQNLVKTFQKR